MINPLVCYYVTRDSVECPACRTAGLADACCAYFYRDYEIRLRCRACRNEWRTKDDLVLDGKEIQGGKDLIASEMM